MPYVDPQTVHNPATGSVIPAAWGDTVRDDLEFLIDPPACSVYHNTTQSLSDDTTTACLANSENYDNDSMHSTSSSTSRITATTAGRYLLYATVAFDASGTGRRLVYMRVNGTTSYLLNSIVPPNSPTTCVVPVFKTLVLAATDYVEVMANQNSGGALNVTLSEFAATFVTR